MFKRTSLIIGALLSCSMVAHAVGEINSLSDGVQAFHQHRWLDAMADFIEVLRVDPDNAEAHKYIPLTIREIDAQNHAVVRDTRINILSGASQRLENGRQDARSVEAALDESTHSEQRAHEERWNAWLEEAKVERSMNHLMAANDLVLRIIAENPRHAGAQQELALLQSDVALALRTNNELLVQERYALEGFYAYGQADYVRAAAAWDKARTLVTQTYPPDQAARQIAAMRFSEYAKQVDAVVAEQVRQAKLDKQFEEGVEHYRQGHYSRALEIFRQVAFAKPEYPQLAYYLVHAENGLEEERTRRLSEARRKQIAEELEKGVALMEHEHYPEAQAAFHHVLSMDPNNPSAQSYLSVVDAEVLRLHDPKNAQLHYEAGLIDYASGKLEDAMREWRTACRMDPQNEKAINALAKVQKELAFNKDLP